MRQALHAIEISGPETTSPCPARSSRVVGATASGKTGLSLDLAERLGGEIVNTDAMQVYRGMDIGTAKLPRRAPRHPHHLLDLLDVTEPATVAAVPGLGPRRRSTTCAAAARAVLVGGSALYTRAILDRFEFPGTDESLRRELEAELERVGSQPCTSGWPGVDPAAAAADHPRQRPPRRTGSRGHRAHRPALTARASRAWSTPTRAPIQIGVDIDRPTLDERISRRVDAMFAAGFVDEVEALLDPRPRARAGPPAARSATARSSASSPATGPWPRRSSRPRPAPGASRAARTGGSARTRGSSGSTTTTPTAWTRPRGRSRRWSERSDPVDCRRSGS